MLEAANKHDVRLRIPDAASLARGPLPEGRYPVCIEADRPRRRRPPSKPKPLTLMFRSLCYLSLHRAAYEALGSPPYLRGTAGRAVGSPWGLRGWPSAGPTWCIVPRAARRGSRRGRCAACGRAMGCSWRPRPRGAPGSGAPAPGCRCGPGPGRPRRGWRRVLSRGHGGIEAAVDRRAAWPRMRGRYRRPRRGERVGPVLRGGAAATGRHRTALRGRGAGGRGAHGGGPDGAAGGVPAVAAPDAPPGHGRGWAPAWPPRPAAGGRASRP